MSSIINAKIQTKINTLEEWQKENATLLQGEFAIVITDSQTTMIKIGDGINKFNDLPYLNLKTDDLSQTNSDELIVGGYGEQNNTAINMYKENMIISDEEEF